MTTTYDSRPDTHEHIGVVRGLMLGVVRDLLHRAHVHDASKLQEPEVSTFDTYTPKLRTTTYGSEEYDRYRAAMGEALAHHYAVNSHHPEHHAQGIADMTLLDVVEMLCDWMAACQRHDDGDIMRSIELNAQRFGYGEEMARLLRNTVCALESAE